VGAQNYYASGQWDFYCDLCGKKSKSSSAVRTWDNRYVCRHHKEVRNPQDFVKGIADDQSTPWSRPGSADTFAPSDGEAIRDTYGDVIVDTSLSPIFDIGS